MAILDFLGGISKTVLSIIILVVLALIGWKIFKRALGIIALVVIAAIILYYFGWLL